MIEYLHYIFEILNNSKYFAGIMMVFLNLGAKHISGEVGEIIDDFFSNYFVRRFIIFCIFWIATRDIIISIVLTVIFIILTFFLFNPKSSFNILLNKNKNKDINKNILERKITPQEIEQAKKILEIAKNQEKKESHEIKDIKNKKDNKINNYKYNINKLRNS
jgi:hypothetical protein